MQGNSFIYQYVPYIILHMQAKYKFLYSFVHKSHKQVAVGTKTKWHCYTIGNFKCNWLMLFIKNIEFAI